MRETLAEIRRKTKDEIQVILKEFDLDLAYEGDSPEDYQLNWKEKRLKFRDEIRCVASFVERNFKEYRFKTPFTWKLMVTCYSDIKNVRKKFIKSEVYEVGIEFDIDSYFTSKSNVKKQIIFNTLTEGVLEIVQEENWDRAPFIDVFSRIENQGLQNHYRWGKSVSNSNRSLKASIFCEHEVEVFNIFAIITDKNGNEISKKLMIVEKPNEWDFHIHLGKILWISNFEVALINKDGTIVNTLRVIQ